MQVLFGIYLTISWNASLSSILVVMFCSGKSSSSHLSFLLSANCCMLQAKGYQLQRFGHFFFMYECFLHVVRQNLPLFTKYWQGSQWEVKQLSILYFLLLRGFFMTWKVSFSVISSTLIRRLLERGSSDKLLRCI